MGLWPLLARWREWSPGARPVSRVSGECQRGEGDAKCSRVALTSLAALVSPRGARCIAVTMPAKVGLAGRQPSFSSARRRSTTRVLAGTALSPSFAGRPATQKKYLKDEAMFQTPPADPPTAPLLDDPPLFSLKPPLLLLLLSFGRRESLSVVSSWSCSCRDAGCARGNLLRARLVLLHRFGVCEEAKGVRRDDRRRRREKSDIQT